MPIRIESLLAEVKHQPLGSDKNDCFVRKQGTVYFIRHISRYPGLKDQELRFAAWLLGNRKTRLEKWMLQHLSAPKKERLAKDLFEAGTDADMYANALSDAIATIPVVHQKRLMPVLKSILIDNFKQLTYRGSSDIEKNSRAIQKMFGLDHCEIEIILFFFMLAKFPEPEQLFERKLQCNEYAGRKYLTNALGLSSTQIVNSINHLEKFGILTNLPHAIRIDDLALNLLQNPGSGQIAKTLFKRIQPRYVPIGFSLCGSGCHRLFAETDG